LIPSFKVPGIRVPGLSKLKIQNANPPPVFHLICKKHCNCLGPQRVKRKKPVNKKSRIGTHPSKVQGK
jgi:hypothetical protein